MSTLSEETVPPATKPRTYTSLPWCIFRWIVLLPACVIVAVIAYFVETIVSGLFGGIVSGLAWCIGAFVAAYAAVATAQYIAPQAHRAAGAAISVAFILSALVGAGNALTEDAKTAHFPAWYSVVFFGIVIVGAISGAVSDIQPSTQKLPASTIPPVVRWVLVLPISGIAYEKITQNQTHVRMAASFSSVPCGPSGP